MNDVSHLVRRYIAVFNETDANKRRAAIAEVFTDSCVYVDPHVDLRGHEAIDQFVAGVQTRFPGVVFSLAGNVDAHHDQARFTWHAGPPGASPLAIGFDVTVFERGRIRQVLGFYDQLPS